jgi:hypothetical protein
LQESGDATRKNNVKPEHDVLLISRGRAADDQRISVLEHCRFN